MRFPRSVRVDDEVVTLELKKTPSRTAEGYGFTGTYRANKATIAKGMTLDAERQTVFCELIHFACDKSTFRDFFSIKTEEFMVHEFAGWFYEVLKQNPDLRNYLFD